MEAPARKGIGKATLEDLYAIPDGEKRFELIEGKIAERGEPTGEHGMAQFKLCAYVHPYHRRSGGRLPGGWWIAIAPDVYLDPANTFRPDMVGWRRERMPDGPRGSPITVRPDWICEILSTNWRNDFIKKKRVCHRHQVPHYWILDPEAETLLVYRWSAEGYTEILHAERGEIVHPEPFEAIPLQVSVLFGDDADEEPAQST